MSRKLCAQFVAKSELIKFKQFEAKSKIALCKWIKLKRLKAKNFLVCITE